MLHQQDLTPRPAPQSTPLGLHHHIGQHRPRRALDRLRNLEALERIRARGQGRRQHGRRVLSLLEVARPRRRRRWRGGDGSAPQETQQEKPCEDPRHFFLFADDSRPLWEGGGSPPRKLCLLLFRGALRRWDGERMKMNLRDSCGMAWQRRYTPLKTSRHAGFLAEKVGS
jgi:hypothetical protein